MNERNHGTFLRKSRTADHPKTFRNTLLAEEDEKKRTVINI